MTTISEPVLIHEAYDNLWKSIWAAGWVDDSGNVEAPTNAFAATTFLDPAQTTEVLHEFADEIAQINAFDMANITGSFGLEQDNNGLIWVWKFESAEDLIAWYAEKERQYALWESGDMLLPPE